MKTKIIAAGTALIILIIIASFSVMSIVQSKTVNAVEKTEVVSSTDSTVSLKWKRVSSADGYYVYQSEAGKDSFEKIAMLEGSRTREFTVENLEQATEYDFYVTAFKKKKDIVESKEHVGVTSCTAPEKQKLEAVESTDAGVLSVRWTINPKAQGYQIQYVNGDGSDFGDATTFEVKDKATGEKVFEELEQKEIFSVRVRSYIHYNGDILYGAWSEAMSAEIAEKVELPSDVDPSKPMVALTFDDGPGYNDASDKILDVLEQYNAKATFFMVGENARDHPKNLQRKVELGCELGNHTWDHENYGSNVSASDIQKCSDAIEEACGARPTCFRSPGGNTTELIRNECKAEGMALYYWSVDTEDWKSRNADSVYNAVMNHVKDGDIILMHEIYSSTAEAIERIVPELIKQGYQLVTCQELIYAKTGKMPEAGQQYLNATTIKNETH